jgi:hypothetical protein
MAMSPRLLRPVATGFHPEANAWRTAVVANGGSVSASTMRSVSQFCADIDAAGLRDRFYRLNLFAGTGLDAALVPLYRGPTFGGTAYGSATDTNIGPFVSGDYSEATGIQGNGSSKCLNTGFNLTELPSVATGHLSAYKGAGAVASAKTPIGVRSAAATDVYRYTNNASNEFALWGEGTSASVAVNTSALYAIISRTSSTNLVLYRNGVSAATSSTSTTPSAANLTNRLIFVCAEGGGTNGIGFWDHVVFAYSIGLALDATQAANLNTAMQAFHAAMGR